MSNFEQRVIKAFEQKKIKEVLDWVNTYSATIPNRIIRSVDDGNLKEAFLNLRNLYQSTVSFLQRNISYINYLKTYTHYNFGWDELVPALKRTMSMFKSGSISQFRDSLLELVDVFAKPYFGMTKFKVHSKLKDKDYFGH